MGAKYEPLPKDDTMEAPVVETAAAYAEPVKGAPAPKPWGDGGAAAGQPVYTVVVGTPHEEHPPLEPDCIGWSLFGAGWFFPLLWIVGSVLPRAPSGRRPAASASAVALGLSVVLALALTGLGIAAVLCMGGPGMDAPGHDMMAHPGPHMMGHGMHDMMGHSMHGMHDMAIGEPSGAIDMRDHMMAHHMVMLGRPMGGLMAVTVDARPSMGGLVEDSAKAAYDYTYEPRAEAAAEDYPADDDDVTYGPVATIEEGGDYVFDESVVFSYPILDAASLPGNSNEPAAGVGEQQEQDELDDLQRAVDAWVAEDADSTGGGPVVKREPFLVPSDDLPNAFAAWARLVVSASQGDEGQGARRK